MNKTLLAVAIGALVAPIYAMAETPTDATITDTLVVTANRTTEQKFDVLAPVEVFDRALIDKIQPRSLAELLDRVAGISTTTSGTAGNTTSMFVRGGNSDHVLVLVDGVRIGAATLGQKNSGDIPIQMIERVEVIRGPRASLWGSDAIAGVIQIFTRKLDTGSAVAGVEVGSYDLQRFHGAIGLGNSDHQYTVAISTEKSAGFDVLNPDANGETDDDGYDRQSLSLNGQSVITEHYQIGLSAQLDKGTTEFDSSFGGNEVSFDNYFVQMSNQVSLESGKISVNFANSADKNHDNADKLFAGSTVSRFETERDQINLLGEWDVNDNSQLSAGVDWYKEQVTSHQQFTATERTAKAAFIVGRMAIDQIKLEGSVRRDEVGDTDAETTHQLAIGYEFSNNLLVSYSRGSAFKAPSFNDLYWPEEFGSRGNPTLTSELADNQELMLRTRGDNYNLEMSLYQTDYDNLINWVYDADSGFFAPNNVEKAKVKGAELTLSIDLMGTDNRLTLSHVDAKDATTGNQLQRRPHFTAFYEWTYYADSWDLGFELRHQGKRNDTGGSLPAYTLGNLAIGYALSGNLNLRAKINNLANKHYVQAAGWPNAATSGYPGADRHFSLALDYKF